MSQSRTVAANAWAQRVRAARAQIERLREVDDPPDFYAPWAKRFALDPRRTDEPALATLRSFVQTGDVWLDIGAGGGRYTLPIALLARRVIALDPSASMLEVLRAGMVEHSISNVEVVEGTWPTSEPMSVDVALMAHVGYDIESFGGAFLDAAEAAAGRLVVIMRTSGAARINEVLWPLIHGQPRQAYPMLPELLELVANRGVSPSVTHVERGSWGYDSREQLLAAARRLLYLREGSDKDRALQRLVMERATERDGQWEVDWTPMQDGIVSWESP